MSVWTVVVAGGGGTRFGGPKQYTMLRGRPLLEWAVAAARAASDGVVLVLPPTDPRLESGETAGAEVVVAGGETRSDSVRAGLRAVPEDATIIVVHDAARPLATKPLFDSVVATVKEGSDGAVPVVRLNDALKRVEGDLVVGEVKREEVRAVQTPQAFRADLLRRAHASGADAADDSALVHALGGRVRAVPGDPRNLKVTTPADLELVQALADQ